MQQAPLLPPARPPSLAEALLCASSEGGCLGLSHVTKEVLVQGRGGGYLLRCWPGEVEGFVSFEKGL